MTVRFRGVTQRRGLLLHGPAGWGEFAAFEEYPDTEAVRWLAAAVEAACDGWPAPLRTSIAINAIVPAVEPVKAGPLALIGGCHTVKVKVAAAGIASLPSDIARVRAVRRAVGPTTRIRVDANGAWSAEQARTAIEQLAGAAGGTVSEGGALEYVEQPCPELDDLRRLRRMLAVLGPQVPVAADDVLRRSDDPAAVAAQLAECADVVILKVAPLGGVRAALRLAAATGLPTVVSSALDTSIGLTAGLALAGVLPGLEYACGLGTGSLLAADVVSPSERLIPVDGVLPVFRAAPEPLAELQLLDAAALKEWTQRLQRCAQLLGGGVTTTS